MTGGNRVRRAAPAVAVLLALAACGDAPLLQLEVVVPEGPDPLAGVTRLRLSVSSPAARTERDVSDTQRFAIEHEISIDGEVGTILLEGFAGDALIARGETPPLALRAVADRMALLVGRAGELSQLSARLPDPGRAMALGLLPGAGWLIAGGEGAAGEALAGASLYDYFSHQLRPTAPLPAPRAGALAATCGALCGVVLLGRDDSGAAQEMLRFDGSAWRALPDGLQPGDRRWGAAIAQLGDGSYLIAGGENERGALATLLRLEPGGDGVLPTLAVLPVPAAAARRQPAAVAAGNAVLLAGGQAPDEPAAELFFPSAARAQPVDLPGPRLAGGAAATALRDGRLLLLGGRDETGALLRDAWIVDPSTLSAEHRADVLAEGREGAVATRLDDQIVVLGGRVADGLAPQAELLAADGLARIGATPLRAPAEGCAVARLGVGSMLVVGGAGAAGGREILEVYEARGAP